MSEVTACKNCRFHVYEQRSVTGIDPWYNHRCSAPGAKKPDEFDPIAGTTRKAEHPDCRSINKGKCPHYLSR